MKELSIEEKAAAYDAAIKKVKELAIDDYLDAIAVTDIFPELNESEDERIRKDILNYIIKGSKSCYDVQQYGREKFEKWIAWLEKQGENISLPKFTFDDVLALQCCMETTKKIQEDKELYEQLQSLHDRLHDAYWLEKQGEQKPADKIEPKFKVGQTIKKEGFNLGFPIVKIEDGFYYNDMGDNFPFTDQDNWELIEQKPAWSEEDEKMIEAIEALCDDKIRFSEFKDVKEFAYTVKNWLKSLKDRVQPQPKQEWSEEDEKNIESIESFLRCPTSIPLDLYDTLTNWLKTIRPQSKWKPTDLQIEALESATANCAYSEYQDCLRELIEQLKKLKG